MEWCREVIGDAATVRRGASPPSLPQPGDAVWFSLEMGFVQTVPAGDSRVSGITRGTLTRINLGHAGREPCGNPGQRERSWLSISVPSAEHGVDCFHAHELKWRRFQQCYSRSVLGYLFFFSFLLFSSTGGSAHTCTRQNVPLNI